MSTFTHYVYRTRFHRGGMISRHRSLAAAEAAAAKLRAGTSCLCGCAVVVPATEIGRLRCATVAASPYEAAL